MTNKFQNTVQFIKDQRDLLSLSSVEINDEGVACIAEAPLQSNQFFKINGQTFYTQIISDGTTHRFQIWSHVGIMPYSAENPEFRKILLLVMKRSREQDSIKLILSKEKNIVVFQEQELTGKIDHLLFVRANIRFLAQSLPFMQIIKSYAK